MNNKLNIISFSIEENDRIKARLEQARRIMSLIENNEIAVYEIKMKQPKKDFPRKLTFKQADDLIWRAYFAGEIKPMDFEYCFCGTLSPDREWDKQYDPKQYPYSINEYKEMETEFLSALRPTRVQYDSLGKFWYVRRPITHCLTYPQISSDEYLETQPGWEDCLFEAMLAARQVLIDIHISRGEAIEDNYAPVKRNLQHA